MAATLEWTHFVANVAEFIGVDVAEIRRESHFYDTLGIDSLGLFSLGMNLVRTYGIKIPLAVVPTIKTVGDAYEALKAHAGQKNASAQTE